VEQKQRTFDLETRLVQYAVTIINMTDRLPKSYAGAHVADQLLRSGTAAAPNYGEAMSAESRRDFVHKLRVGLKELRESRIWLKIILLKGFLPVVEIQAVLDETDELSRIFNASIQTALANDRLTVKDDL